MVMRGETKGSKFQARAPRLLVAAVLAGVLAGVLAAGSAQGLGSVDAHVTGPAAVSAHADAHGAAVEARAADLGLPAEGIPPLQARVAEPVPGVARDAPLRLDSLAPAGGPLGAGPLGAGPLPDALRQPAVQVGATLSFAALLLLALRALAFAPLAPLASRIDAEALLDHPTRRELLRIIGEEPGVNISDLHARLAMGWGSLLYHLQRLEAQGLVQSHRWGRSRRYFLNERSVSVRAAAIRALKAQNARVLAEQIAAMPGATQEQLALTMGVSKSVVSKYAQRLEEVSLVERQVGRNCLRLYPKDSLRELLHTMPPVPPMPPAATPAGLTLPPASVPDDDQPAEGRAA